MRLRLTPPGRSAAPRTGPVLAAAAVAALGAALLPAAPAAAQDEEVQSSTTAAPAGHAFTASLVAGGVASFTVGAVTVTCDTSSTSGAVPAEPDNVNPAGPVTGPITAPEFANAGEDSCPTNIVFTNATSTTSGDWTISLQYDPAGSTGTLTVPQGGLVAEISGLASCTITAAPDGPAGISGAWADGADGALPTLTFTDVAVPITVTGGFGCPTAATSATFSASYEVADTTDPTQVITVTA